MIRDRNIQCPCECGLKAFLPVIRQVAKLACHTGEERRNSNKDAIPIYFTYHIQRGFLLRGELNMLDCEMSDRV